MGRIYHTTTLKQSLHDGILAGEEGSLSLLVRTVLPAIVRRLRTVYRATDDGTLIDAADDAVVSYALRPVAYDAQKGLSLESYLYWAARRNVVDAIKAIERRHTRELAFTAQHLCPQCDSPAAVEHQSAFLMEETFRGVDLSKADYCVMMAYASGAQSTELVSLLGVGALPVEDQRRELKRLRDRVIKRLRRHAGHAARRAAHR